jgi:hypothetical protein
MNTLDNQHGCWAEVANALPAVRSNANPVMAIEAMGLTPISPVIAEVGIVEIPDLARITKFPAVPKFTGAWAAGATYCMSIKATATRPIRTRFFPFTTTATSGDLVFICFLHS